MSKQGDGSPSPTQSVGLSTTSHGFLSDRMRQARILDEFLAMEHNLGWQRGAILDMVRFKWTENGCQIMLKAHKGKERGVAFVNAHNLADAIEVTGTWVKEDALKWRRDKY